MTSLRRLRLLALAAGVALAGVACSSSDDDDEAGAGAGTDASSSTTAVRSAAEIASGLQLVSEGKLTACTAVPSVPFAFEENGQLDGIDIELIRAVAGRLALTTEFKVEPVDGLFAALGDRRCDLVAASLPISDDRPENVDFSEPYVEVKQSLLVRKGDESTLDELGALAGRTIGVQPGTAGAAFAASNAGGATVRELPGTAELFAALEGRQVDAVLHDLPVNAYRALSSGTTVVATVFAEGSNARYGLALRKDEATLKKAIDDAIAQVRSDDTFPTVLRRFLGDRATDV